MLFCYSRLMKRTSGFTLLEVSIVLTIIALLVGGIFAGRALIRSAALRSTIEEIHFYSNVFHQFKDKYGMYPGDFNEATSLWGAASTVSDAVCYVTAGTGTQTCNGNGNGRIGNYSSDWYEGWRAWQHLENARMISGHYTGLEGHAGVQYGYAGENVPMSAIESVAGYGYNWYGTLPVGGASFFGGKYGNVMLLGKHSQMDQGVMTGDDAFDIDLKIDDGRPGFGNARAPHSGLRPNCVDGTTDPITANYLRGNPLRDCSMIFILN